MKVKQPKTRREAHAALLARGSLPMLGAEVAVRAAPSPVAHPLGPPTISGTDYTVDLMLNQPTRITRMIMDLTLQRFVADRVFTSAGGVTGGAVVFDEVQQNELYLARDIGRVAPGAEFPIVSSERLVPKIAEVEKWGGKVFTTDEARDRNNTAAFTNTIRQLANTVVRKINQRAVETLMASIASSGQTFTGRNWSTVVVGGSQQSNVDLFPARDLAHAARLADEDELGVSYTLLLLNPQEFERLVLIYGATGIGPLLGALNLSIYVSNRIPAGTGIYVAEGQVGEMRVEKPLGTETWREQGTERTWTQSSVRPVMYVTNPFAVLQVVGLAG